MRLPLYSLLFCLATGSLLAEPGIYVAAGHGGHRMASKDGLAWTHHHFWGKPAHNQQDLKAIATGNGTVVVVGGFSKSNILVTTDGVSWEQPGFNMGVLSGVLFRDGRFLAFGEGGRVAESKDGLEWTLIGDAEVRKYAKSEGERLGTDRVKVNVRKWREANGVYVGAGDNSILVSTRDFKKWHFAERKEPLSRLMLESDGKTFVAVGGQTLDWSTDGETWTRVPFDLAEKEKFNNIVYDGERFILTTAKGKAWESGDGQDWSPISNATFSGTIAALRPDLYYAFETYWKFTEEMLVSTDGGKNWEPVELPAPVGVTCIIHAPDIPPF